MSKYILKGVVLPFGKKSSVRDRVYTKECVEEAFNQFSQDVANNKMVGCLESRHFPNVEAMGDVPIEVISHVVKETKLTDEGIEATIEVLDTKEGDMVKQLMNHDIALWGGICGYGTQNDAGGVTLDRIKCINLTCCPSFNPDEYPPLMPDGASSGILKKELEDRARREKLMKKSN